FPPKLLAKCAFSEPMNSERESCCVRKCVSIPANSIVPVCSGPKTETKTFGSEFAVSILGFGRSVFFEPDMHVSKTGQSCLFRVVGLFARLGSAAGLAFLDGASLAGHHPRRRIRFPSGKCSQPARGETLQGRLSPAVFSQQC